MWKYVVKRLIYIIPILLAVALIIFLLVRMVPGDPARVMLGGGHLDYITDEDIAEVHAYMGLDKPLLDQYILFMGNLLQGNLGKSYFLDRDVTELILERFPATLILAVMGMVIAIGLSLPIGVIAATRQFTKWNYMSMFGALLGVSIPPFVLAIFFVVIFSLGLGWFPVAGMGDPPDLNHLVLPAFTMGLMLTASNSRLTRSSMLEVLREDYVRTAMAKGCSRRKVIWWHALRNALLPVVTNYGLEIGRLMVGALFVEIVFAWPGLGRLTYDALRIYDYPIIQGCVLFIAVVAVFANLIVDLMYTIIDPRIKYA